MVKQSVVDSATQYSSIAAKYLLAVRCSPCQDLFNGDVDNEYICRKKTFLGQQLGLTFSLGEAIEDPSVLDTVGTFYSFLYELGGHQVIKLTSLLLEAISQFIGKDRISINGVFNNLFNFKMYNS